MSQTVYCRSCGQKIDDEDVTCLYCGATQPVMIKGKRDRLSAAFLAFIVGGFGIHKFYLGQNRWGIIYLIFCWTFIPYAVAFVECIILLFMTDDEFNAKFNKEAFHPLEVNSSSHPY